MILVVIFIAITTFLILLKLFKNCIHQVDQLNTKILKLLPPEINRFRFFKGNISYKYFENLNLQESESETIEDIESQLYFNLKHYSNQEISEMGKRYIPIYISNQLPDYSKYYPQRKILYVFRLKRKNAFDGIKRFSEIFNEMVPSKTLYLVLGSAGIGKTTFLLNLFLSCNRHLVNSKIQILSFRSKCLEAELKNIKSEKRNTILLLDGYDEVEPMNNYSFEKLAELTREFKYVLVTARIEFFKDPLKNEYTTSMLISENFNFYKIAPLFIAPFTEHDVQKYLKKSFHVGQYKCKIKEYLVRFIYFVFGHPDVVGAQVLLNKVKFTSLRPLFLSFVTDLITSDIDKFEFDYEIYDDIISKWIDRECETISSDYNIKNHFFKVFEKIACELYSKKKIALEYEEIELLTKDFKTKIREFSVKSKSLFIRNNLNQYYFLHSSLCDYFIAKKTFTEFKEKIPPSFFFDNELSLKNRLRDEMFLKHLFIEKKLVTGITSLKDNPFTTEFNANLEDLRSSSETRNIKYISITECKIDLHFLYLFPNLKTVKFENELISELKPLSYLSNIETLDLSNCKIKISLKGLENIKELKTLKIYDANVDLSTINPLWNIKSIIVSKKQYSDNLISKFPRDVVKIYEKPLNEKYEFIVRNWYKELINKITQ